MASWNFVVYLDYHYHTFLVRPHMSYDDLRNDINSRLDIIEINYLLRVYDERFRRYIELDDRYLTNLRDRLPRTSTTTLKGQIVWRRRVAKTTVENYKSKNDVSSIPRGDYVIIWLDSYICSPENCRQLKHKFSTMTMVETDRPILKDEYDINHLICANFDPSTNKDHLNTFTTKQECVDFLSQIQSSITIVFITSHSLGKQIVPLIAKRVHMIYLLRDDFYSPSYEWAFDYDFSLQMFDHEISLLVRLIRDLAEYFVEKAEMSSQLSVNHSITFLRWARKLHLRANEIDEPTFVNNLKLIEQKLDKMEHDNRSETEYHDDDKEQVKTLALQCDES